MNNHQLDKLLELKIQRQSTSAEYRSSEEFIERFERRLKRQRIRARLRFWAAIAAASLMILLGQLWISSIQKDHIPAAPAAYEAKPGRLAAAERHFGSKIGIMFVNDDLLIFERQDKLATTYNISIQLFSAKGEMLTSLEFATTGNDYIILDNEMIKGRIFLNRCDNHTTIVELDLQMRDARQREIVLAEIIALEQSGFIQALDNGSQLMLNLCRRDS